MGQRLLVKSGQTEIDWHAELSEALHDAGAPWQPQWYPLVPFCLGSLGGLGFRVWVWGLGFRVWGLGFGV